eukprot:167116-Rhodomonas_salina.1
MANKVSPGKLEKSGVSVECVQDNLESGNPPDKLNENLVTSTEIEWMISKRPLVFDLVRLNLDYDPEEVQEMVAAFTEHKVTHLRGILNYPGVGTRWRVFLDWWDTRSPEEQQALSTEEHTQLAFTQFANHLGRVVSYRALALDRKSLDKILEADEIFPSGQLRQTADQLAQVLDAHGVRKVVVARLYISHLKRLIGHDPSISLHDDWQTTTCIASGYASFCSCDPSQSKNVYLFEISVPVVESLGWTLQQVAMRSSDILGPAYAKHEQWFQFAAPAAPKGVWFDASLQRTERY